MYKQTKKISRYAMEQVKTGVILGVGGSVIQGVGGNAGAINTFSGYMVPLANVQAGGVLLGALGSLGGKNKKRKKY